MNCPLNGLQGKLGILRTILLRTGVCAAVCLGAAASASAQIYSWRDANGNMVLSNLPAPAAAPSVRSYAVPQSEALRTTRFVPADRASAYNDLIEDHAQRNGVRADLVRAVVQVESAFNPDARSPKGALGLMQLMPATIQQFGVNNPFDPKDNVRAGVAYLRQLLDRYQNNEELALAAYNAGPGAVDRHGQSVPPYAETRNYVRQINHLTGQQAGQSAGLNDTRRIYKVTDVVDGRRVVRYTDKKPSFGFFEIVSSR